MRKKTLLAAALLTLLAVPFAAQAAQPGGQAARDPETILHNLRALSRYLGLTADQVAKTRTLQQQLQATVKPLHDSGKALREQYRAALEATPQNACSIGDLAIDIYENQEKVQDAVETFDTQFSALLTPAQLTKYEALKAAARLLREQDEE
jgi:Spy/CpxP family protein refolding chaperone